MYRVNELPRKVLITPDEVIAWGPTDGAADPRNILLAIQIAEDRFVRPVICKDLYNDFREQKNVEVTEINKTYLESLFPSGTSLSVGSLVNALELVTDTWYKKLWNEQLWKLVAECVIYIASPTNFSRYTAAGEMVNNPKVLSMSGEGSGSNTVDLKDMKWKMDKLLMDRIDPLIATTQEYLCDNVANFPKYNCRKCSCDDSKNGISYQRKTAWIHVYDDNDSRCNNCNDD